MATVNHYFQSGVPMGRATEQNLYEDLIIECLRIYGFEIIYIPRKAVNEDRILGEDPLSRFEHAYPIEMYMENVQGLDGEGELLSKFGVETRESATFVVSRRRWLETVGRTGNTVLDIRPAEGDVLFFPLTKSYFEIRKVEGDQPFYQVGKLYVFRLQCELMQMSSEEFNTGEELIDDTYNNLGEDITRFMLMNEDGVDGIYLEYTTNTPMITEDYVLANLTDGGARNEDFNTNIEEILDFTERNPFGEVFK